MKKQRTNRLEGGTATVEFVITAAFFFMMTVSVVSSGHMFFTHNALVESTRRGARYAATQCMQGEINCPNSDTSLARIRNVVLYGSTTAGSSPLVYNLQPANIIVEYSVNTAPAGQPPNDFGIGRGTVSVKIINYDYTFALAGASVRMPAYLTTVAGENAGYLPGITCPLID